MNARIATPISRRGAVKAAGIAAVAGAAASSVAFADEAAADKQGTPIASMPSFDAANLPDNTPNFLIPPAPIEDFADTQEFDVVIVGAGNAGLAAAKAAHDAGANVAVLVREGAAVAQGMEAASIDLEKTSEAGIEACVSMVIQTNDHRANRALVESWARNSSEAVRSFEDYVTACGVEGTPIDYSVEYNGYPIYFHLANYEELDGGYASVASAVSAQLEADGVSFFYNAPAVQLHKDGERVDGAIAETDDGVYTLFKASKGVILATGCYMNNPEMVAYYMPDCLGLKTGAINKFGDGHRMGVWAGGHIENINHCKMVHEGLGGRRCDVPFMAVGPDGKRFMCEGPTMGYTSNYWHEAVQKSGNIKAGIFYQICDANWKQQGEEMVEVDPFNNDISTVREERFVSGNTIEELGEAINAYCKEKEIDWQIDVDGLVESVARYNELVAAGADDDFGKNAAYLKPIDTPPFYGIRRGDGGVAAILGGLVINTDCQVLNDNDEPIEGLFATGNVSGPFFGGVDYPMYIHGLSIGRALTTGYIAGRFAASL